MRTDLHSEPTPLTGLRSIAALLQPFLFGLMFLGLFFAIVNPPDRNGYSAGHPEEAWMILIALGTGAGVSLFALPLVKRVRITHDALLVGNYLHEIRIPFEEINHVSNEGSVFGAAIRVHLASQTRFGTSITFLPKSTSHHRITAGDVLTLMDR
ncbi:MAG TPA: hypothetical protein VHI13_00930 [Candidatus Kapabacteria bacterium]|nr:hypothetical protein [Candidatus Kapabacteria bacterium]